MSWDNNDERAEERAVSMYEEIERSIKDILHCRAQKASFQDINKRLHLLSERVTALGKLCQAGDATNRELDLFTNEHLLLIDGKLQ